MFNMFSECVDLTEFDLSVLDTSIATDMGSMFFGFTSLNEITVGTGWNKTYVPGLSGSWYDDKGKTYETSSEIAPNADHT